MAVVRGAVIIVANMQGQILLLKRSASASHHPGKWENPGGKVEACESYEDAARREVLEEAGVDATDLTRLYEKTVGDDERDDDFHVVVFSMITDQSPRLSEDTFSKWAWVNKADLGSFDLAVYVLDDFRSLGYIE